MGEFVEGGGPVRFLVEEARLWRQGDDVPGGTIEGPGAAVDDGDALGRHEVADVLQPDLDGVFGRIGLELEACNLRSVEDVIELDAGVGLLFAVIALLFALTGEDDAGGGLALDAAAQLLDLVKGQPAPIAVALLEFGKPQEQDLMPL